MVGRIRKSPPRLCDEPGCDRVHIARGRCPTHYQAWRASDDFTPSTFLSSAHRIQEFDEEASTGICSQCGPVDISMRLSRGNRRPVCLVKAREEGRKKRKNTRESPEKLAARNAYHAKYARAVKYGMTTRELDALLATALGCEICGVELSPNTAHLDHDHSCCPPAERKGCGQCLRGILCPNCNYGLGHFRDDPERLRSAIDYLARSVRVVA